MASGVCVLDTPKSDGTVGKALHVLDQVAAFERPVRFSELLAESPFPKPTLYRFVQTLTKQGMLSFDDERGTYAVGTRLVRLAYSAWNTSTLAPIAKRHLEDLAAKVEATVHLAQLDNGQVLFIDKQRTNKQFETLAQAGMVAPCYCTGVGKVMLAFSDAATREHALDQQSFTKRTDATLDSRESYSAELDKVVKEGVGFDREEHERGIISIAAPILTSKKKMLGALSVASSTMFHSLDDLTEFRPALLETASKIGAEAEIWRFPSRA